MVYKDWLETNLLQQFAHPQNSQRLTVSSAIIFEVNIIATQKQA